MIEFRTNRLSNHDLEDIRKRNSVLHFSELKWFCSSLCTKVVCSTFLDFHEEVIDSPLRVRMAALKAGVDAPYQGIIAVSSANPRYVQ